MLSWYFVQKSILDMLYLKVLSIPHTQLKTTGIKLKSTKTFFPKPVEALTGSPGRSVPILQSKDA